MISQRDVEQYRERGYLVVPDVLDSGMLARVRAALDELVDRYGIITPPTAFSAVPWIRRDTKSILKVRCR